MKMFLRVSSICLLLCGGSLFAQRFFGTNWISQEHAIKLVSRLKKGMPEEDAAPLLETNKLHMWTRVGAAGGWDAIYVLTNGCSLHLSYTARTLALDGRWGGNGLLQSAFIQSNNVNIIPISLTNAP